MDDLNHMTLESFKLWTIHALKVFLSHRNKSVDGTFDELAARAFCAWEENLPVNEKAEQAEQRLLHEYKEKLIIDGDDVIPDPFALTTGWEGEKTAMEKWPSVYLSDIAIYLNNETTKDIFNRLLNEYKEGKAFRYFDSEWVKEIWYHDIRANSGKCILKAKCTPSMSINSKYYDVWIVVRKDDEDGHGGGEILSAYCTCTAGMLGTCNHIAGVLFRVENAVKTGATTKSSTSRKSTWNVPKGKTTFNPVMAKDVAWKKGHYAKTPVDVEEETRTRMLKNSFTPLNKKQSEAVKNLKKIRQDIHDLVKDDAPNSCFVLMMDKRRNGGKTATATITLPPSMVDLAKDGNCDRDVFLQKISVTNEQCDALSQATADQASCQLWKDQRKGRITASNYQRVSSRVDTMRKKAEADPSALIASLMGTKEVHPTVQMKHGVSLEPHAKKAYVKQQRKQHKHFKSNESGLLLLTSKPYLAASADLEVECGCCGKGLCEIKCPESIKGSVPSVENVKWLIVDNNTVTLDKRHTYYYQIQGQMGVHSRPYCDLFVYTFHGSVTVRIPFDNEFWATLEEKLSWFWHGHVLPQLLAPPKEITIPSLTPAKTSRALRPLTFADNVQPPKKRLKLAPVYLCGQCGLDCQDDPQSDADQSVLCDSCGMWVHYVCASVTTESLENVDKWMCGKCRN